MSTIITTGRTMSSYEWAKAMEDLEARAALAERAGLPKSAKSWRDAIDNMARRRLSDGNLGPSEP
jgi:hypothetical protein